ncbi:MAG: universal stress protein [Planctomycetota bacterium]|jgi:nucleotide-binding universal stress UspA family protein
MYPFKRLLVGLDLSGRERSTLRYASMGAKITQPRRIYFCHVASRSDILDKVILERHPELKDAMDKEIIEQEMRDLVEKEFEAPPDAEIKYLVVYDNPLRGLLQCAIDKDIDLMIVGSKSGNRVLPEKLARNAHCSVLVIPEGAHGGVSRLMVPLDFSDLCSEAMKVALSCYRVGCAEYMLCRHVYKVPAGYHKLGKSRSRFTVVMRDNARKDYADFIKPFDLTGINMKMDYTKDMEISDALIQGVKEHDIDMIIIGARGRTSAASFLLGSVTEKLIRRSFIPVLAVKKKGANLGILQAMFEI